MDIAAASMSLSMMNVGNQASVAILKKAMDAQSQTAEAMIQDLARAVPAPPMPAGQHLDVYI